MESTTPFPGIVVLVFFLSVYFLPTLEAVYSRRKHAACIFVVNLLLGWTLLGWIGALAWAFNSPKVPRRSSVAS